LKDSYRKAYRHLDRMVKNAAVTRFIPECLIGRCLKEWSSLSIACILKRDWNFDQMLEEPVNPTVKVSEICIGENMGLLRGTYILDSARIQDPSIGGS
jgi:hypothetical protein